MSILSGVVLDTAAASRRANGGARRVGIVAMAVLALMALGADPDANATGPAPGCPQGRAPAAPGAGCDAHAFRADIGAAGLGDTNGDVVAQGLAMCGLMDAGLSPQSLVSQFLTANPALGPDGAAQVVRIAIRDLCPWHR
jgi:hypothetical protein